MSIQMLVAKAVLQDADYYAGILPKNVNGSKTFKKNPTVKGVKRFLTETIILGSRGSTPSKLKPSQLLAELDADDDEGPNTSKQRSPTLSSDDDILDKYNMPRRATRSTSNPGPSAADVVSTVNRPAVKQPAKKATRPAKKSRSTSSQIPVQAVEVAATALTPDLLEQLVTKVADVVIQRLSGNSMGTNPTASVSLPGLSSPHPPDASILRQPVDHNILQKVQPTIDSLVEVAVGRSPKKLSQ
ncbi:Hypothetical predicted protein, partial [Paramuricea clavata]